MHPKYLHGIKKEELNQQYIVYFQCYNPELHFHRTENKTVLPKTSGKVLKTSSYGVFQKDFLKMFC